MGSATPVLRGQYAADTGWNLPLLPYGRVIAAARTLRGWSQKELADASGVPERTLRRLEQGALGIGIGTFLRVIRTLEAEGIEVSGGGGVRISLKVVRGSEADRLIEAEGRESESPDEAGEPVPGPLND